MHKLVFDRKVLKAYCSKKSWTYKELAQNSGLSSTQAYHLLHRTGREEIKGGSVTFGCLASLEIPGLFFLETKSHLQTIRRPLNVSLQSGE